MGEWAGKEVEEPRLAGVGWMLRADRVGQSRGMLWRAELSAAAAMCYMLSVQAARPTGLMPYLLAWAPAIAPLIDEVHEHEAVARVQSRLVARQLLDARKVHVHHILRSRGAVMAL